MKDDRLGTIIGDTDIEDIKIVLEDIKSLDGSDTVLEMMEELEYHVERIEEILLRIAGDN